MKKLLTVPLLFLLVNVFSQQIIVRQDYGCKFAVFAEGHSGADNVTAIQNLGIKCSRPAQVRISTFSGNQGELNLLMAANIKVIVNLNWICGCQNGGAFPSPSDENTFRNRLDAILDTYADIIDVAVIENEPTNGNYYDQTGFPGTYIRELRWAVEECNRYNVRITDGSLHLANFGGYPGQITVDNIGGRLLDSFATLNLDYVNIHFRVPDTHMQAGGVWDQNYPRAVLAYMKRRSGHPVTCNEYTQVESSVDVTTTQSVAHAMKFCRIHNVTPFTVNTLDDPRVTFFNEPNSTLNANGQAYRTEVHVPE